MTEPAGIPNDEWARVCALFDEIVELDPAAAEARLAGEPDSELARQARELWVADRAAGPLRSTPTHDSHVGAASFDLEPGSRLGAWTVDGVLGRGGMGTVYAAHRSDGSFERVAALKLVRGVTEIPALRVRFEEERRLLASLDHPGIARLLDAGTSDSGLPFLVLERVDGEPIDAYCERRGLPPARRLSLFLEACEAVSFAHQALILHRDLKPSNLLVDAAGRVKLLDFGIAKLLDPMTGAERDLTRTALAQRPLTVSYASPEQLRGELLSTASDVWSLGVVLHRIIVGALPFPERADESPTQRAARLELGSATIPRQLDPDLAAVLETALAPERERRYGTVAELAADLQRFLDGRPVHARGASWSYRARKLVVRHRWAVAGSLLLVGILSAATFLSLRQAEGARRERDLARQRFEDVRQLAGVFLFDVHDRLGGLPGSLSTRELLVRTGLEYFDRLAASGGSEPDFQAELASGYERLGDLQGRPFGGAQRGDTRGALTTFEKAHALRTRLLAEAFPSSAEAARDLAGVELRLGETLFALGEREAGLARVRAGQQRLTPEPIRGLAGSPLLIARLARIEGQLVATGGDLSGGEERLRSALATFQSLSDAEPENRPLRRELSRTLVDLGGVVGNGAAPDAVALALALDERAFAIDHLMAESASDLAAQRQLLRSSMMTALLLGYSERNDESLALLEDALRRGQAQFEREPEDRELERQVATLRESTASQLTYMGRPLEAEPLLRRATADLERAAHREPGNVRIAVNLSMALFNLSETLDRIASLPAMTDVKRAALRREACDKARHSAAVSAPLLTKNILIGTELANARQMTERAAACGPATP